MTTVSLSLGEGSIHIWRVILRAPVELERAFEKTFSGREILRRQGFVNSTLGRRFTVSQGVLRVLLSRYLGTCPAKIVFGYGRAGKPFVENYGARIEFNVSHSDDLAVYAFARKCRLGVDIERIRAMADLKEVAKLSLNEQEYVELLSLEETEQTEAFFRCWTRKEAYVKAVGQGLSLALQSFQVSLRPEEPATLRSLPPGDCCQTWTIRDITQADYAGAVAVDSANHAIEYQPCYAAENLSDFL